MTRMFASRLSLLIFLCLAAILLCAFRLFTFSYFWWDDFNNLFLIQQSSAWSLLWHIVNPLSAAFRPVGMLFYWIHWHLFDLSSFPYHVFQWIIHSLNVLLVYLLLKDLVESDYGAAVGAMLFTFQAAYWELFWSFWAIFELFSALLFFIGLRIYLRRGDRRSGILLASAIYILAVKTKEMAITLPVIWLLFELIVGKAVVFPSGRKDRLAVQKSIGQLRNLGQKFLIPVVIAAWLTYLKVSTLAGMVTSIPYSPSFPYYMSFSLNDLVTGYSWYFDAIFHTHFGWIVWSVVIVLSLGLLIYLRERLGLFFLAYIFVSFLPAVVLVNHRYAYYWYIPFFGLCGMAALVLKRMAQWARKGMSAGLGLMVGGLIFVCFGAANFLLQQNLCQPQRQWAREVANEYRSFILGLRALPPPPLKETIYYKSVPRYFDAVSIVSATQVAFRRPDVGARMVEEFPPDSRYRLRFENLSVIQERE